MEAFVNSRGIEAVIQEHELFDSAEGLMLHYVERMDMVFCILPIIRRHDERVIFTRGYF